VSDRTTTVRAAKQMNEPRDFSDDELPPGELDARTAALQATVDDVVRHPCAVCHGALCGHEALLAVVLGSKNAPRCARCAAAETHESAASLVERALQWIVRRDCFAHVWRRAGTSEGHGAVDRPPCLFAAAATAPRSTTVTAPPAPTAEPAASWDAGDLGCGDLVLELRLRLRELPAGAVMHVVARDPAAPVDLPAWCGLVGHTLLSASHPHYRIQRKRD